MLKLAYQLGAQRAFDEAEAMDKDASAKMSLLPKLLEHSVNLLAKGKGYSKNIAKLVGPGLAGLVLGYHLGKKRK